METSLLVRHNLRHPCLARYRTRGGGQVVEDLAVSSHVLSLAPFRLGSAMHVRQSSSSAVRSGETPAKHWNARLQRACELFDDIGEPVRGLTEAKFDDTVGRDWSAQMPYPGLASSPSQLGPDEVSHLATRLAAKLNSWGEER